MREPFSFFSFPSLSLVILVESSSDSCNTPETVTLPFRNTSLLPPLFVVLNCGHPYFRYFLYQGRHTLIYLSTSSKIITARCQCHGYANRWNPGARDAPSQSLREPIRCQEVSRVISELSRRAWTEHSEHPDGITDQGSGKFSGDQ